MRALTIALLSGTLAKPTKPTLQPNFAKEPSNPSHTNAGLRHIVLGLTVKTIENKTASA